MSNAMTIDDVLNQIRVHLTLEAEAEQKVLEEIRGHLEEAVADARARGMSEQQAVRHAAASFGIEQVGNALNKTHASRGIYEGIAAAALPVLFALILRWLIFAPNGTADGWQPLASAPALVLVVGVAMLIPILRFRQRRYALVLWTIFWGLSLITLVYPTLRW